MPDGVILRDWYEKPTTTTSPLTLQNILTHWDTIETDFHNFYHCDFGTGILTQRRWGWFLKRLLRLLQEPTLLAEELGLRTRTTLF